MANPWDPRVPGGASGSDAMQPSTWRTISVPGVPAPSPSNLAMAMDDRPMRVLVDNVGPVPLRIAGTATALAGSAAAATDHYVMLPGAHRVFVLAPKQRMFAVAIGAGGLASVHASDALPYDTTVTAV